MIEKSICNRTYSKQNQTHGLDILLPVISNRKDIMKLLSFKCKVCGMQFDEKERLQIHKEVHQHKQKNDGWTRHWYWEPYGIEREREL
jgi:predicted restriction endonuclease